jgi:hypothetical protein
MRAAFLAFVFALCLGSFAIVTAQNSKCSACVTLAELAEVAIGYFHWNATQLESELSYVCSLTGQYQTEVL